MVKRLVLGAAFAAAAAVAAPASADPVSIDTCYATVQMPCGICTEKFGCIALR